MTRKAKKTTEPGPPLSNPNFSQTPPGLLRELESLIDVRLREGAPMISLEEFLADIGIRLWLANGENRRNSNAA